MTKYPWVEEETYYRAYLTEDLPNSFPKKIMKGDIIAEGRDLQVVLQRSVMRPVRIVKVQTWSKLKVQEEEIWSSEGKWPESEIEESEDV